jgi:transposase
MGLMWRRLLSESKIPKRYRLRVRERLVVVEYAEEHGVRAAARRYGLDRKTVRAWRNRAVAAGVGGLVPRYPKTRARRIADDVVELIKQARVELGYGSTRTQLWLQRVHRVRVAQSTIQRIVRACKLPPVKPARKRRPKQLKLFERERPGDCVQVDVKFVRVGYRRMFQYTAIDDCSRYRVLRLYAQANVRTSVAFLAELLRVLPFRIRRLQTDNGAEFQLGFRLSVQAEWQGRAESPHRSRGILEPPPLHPDRRRRGRARHLGAALQRRAVFHGAARSHTARAPRRLRPRGIDAPGAATRDIRASIRSEHRGPVLDRQVQRTRRVTTVG